MPTIDLGRVKGDTGVSMRSKGSWTPSTAYVNNSQYIDVVTNGGNSYACKTSHTSGSTFSSDNWNLVAQKGAKGDKGDKGNTPTIQAGTVTSLASTAAPTVTATTSGETTTLNFGIPKGDTSKIETPTFSDTVSTYTTLAAANTAAETASNAIKSKVSIFTTLSNMKKSFSAIVQGLKILATNVGAIRGITSDISSESTAIAASSKMVHDLNSNLPLQTYRGTNIKPVALNTNYTYQHDSLKGKHCVVAIFYSSVGNVLLTRYSSSKGMAYVQENHQHWGGEIDASFNHTTGTITFRVLWLGSSQNLDNFALTGVLF